MAPPLPISLTGCGRCGIEPEGHEEFHAFGEDSHPFRRPSAVLTFARMLARRAARTTTNTTRGNR